MIFIGMQLLLYDSIEIKFGQIDHYNKIFKKIFDTAQFKSFQVCTNNKK